MSPGGRFLAFANENYGLTPGQITEEMAHVYARGDRVMGYFVLGHIAVAVAQAFAFSTWNITLPVTVAAAAMFFSSVALLPGTLFTRYIAGIVLQIFVALHIYQMHGMPEMHFYFFTAQTMLIVYQDWRATWPGTALIIAQHILFAVLQNTGSNLYFFPDSYITVRKLAFHFGIALVQTVICTYFAILQKRHRLQTLSQHMEMRTLKEEAERANRASETSRAQTVATARLSALGQMAGGIAHEINNPLAIISASAQNLSRMAEHGEVRVPELLKQVGHIAQTSDRIARIVKSLRHVSRDDSRDDFRRLPISEIIDECMELCGEQFRVHSIRLSRPAPGPPVSIWCRESQIGQVLLNLLQNAFDAVVDCEAEKWVEVGVAIRDRSVILSVANSGPLIAPELRAQIMEPFFTTKPVGKGTGLGLSLSRNIAEAHSGVLELSPAPGYTRFLLTLPVAADDTVELAMQHRAISPFNASPETSGKMPVGA